MGHSSFVKFLIEEKTTMIKEEITEQTIKAIPAVGGAVATTLTLNEWVALATLLYIIVQTVILLHKHYYFVKQHRELFGDEEE